MSDTPSNNGDDDSKSPYQARKDKACPFCHQAFTSSSLGRHLDLWIKPKNPKPADGVHHVDEIKKIRGAVTRRQAKQPNGSRRYSTTPAATPTATSVSASRRSPAASEDVNSAAFHSIRPSGPTSPVARKDSAAAIPGFNVHSFAVTGVINNIERNNNDGNMALSTTQGGVPHGDVTQEIARKIQDAEDRARAAELALREMICSWRAAKTHIDMSSMPFDYDPLSFDFPALTLQCLPPPPTLSSDHPISTDSSWDIQPPGVEQCTALQAYFSEEFRKWRIKCAAATTAFQEDIQYPPSQHALPDPQELIQRAEEHADSQEKKVKHHIHTAYNTWETLTEEEKKRTWLLELARSVDKKQKHIEKMQAKQHSAQQEIANLRSQIDQLNKLQQPREFKMQTPVTLPISPEFLDFCLEQAVVYGRRGVGMTLADRRLDTGVAVKTAVDRWKHVVVSNRILGGGIGKKRTLEQADLGGEEHYDNVASSASVPDKTAMRNKSRAVSTRDGHRQPRPERFASNGISGQPAVVNSTSANLVRAQGEGESASELQAASTRSSTAPEMPRANMTNGYAPSAPAGVETRLTIEGANKSHDEDADAERDDEMSDENAEHDDGMSDRDADAEMEDDDTLGYAPVQNSALVPATVVPPLQAHHQAAAPSRPHVQLHVPAPQTRPSSLPFGGGANSYASGSSIQPTMNPPRYTMPKGGVRAPIAPQHGN